MFYLNLNTGDMQECHRPEADPLIGDLTHNIIRPGGGPLWVPQIAIQIRHFRDGYAIGAVTESPVELHHFAFCSQPECSEAAWSEVRAIFAEATRKPLHLGAPFSAPWFVEFPSPEVLELNLQFPWMPQVMEALPWAFEAYYRQMPAMQAVSG